jgi:hypothetical protein
MNVRTFSRVQVAAFAIVLSGLSPMASAATLPLVLYTDILSGPTSGGEGDRGIYLSIFGIGFGSSAGLGSTTRVFIGNAEVGRYISLGPSRGRPDIQQITVQVGALGNPTPGVTLPIRVVVGSVDSNVDHTFTANPGRIFFVDNVSGSDTTGTAGDIGRPFRHVQTPSLGGAWGQVRAGDFIVMRGKGQPWTDVGFEGYFLRYRDKSGSAPTGASGTGPIVVMGYPSEDVNIHGLLANGMTGGCISSINGETYPAAGKWAVITNLRVDCEGYDGPVSQQIHGDNWRVVNNDLSAPTAPTSGPDVPRMGGITGNGQSSVWFGNHIHDIQGSEQECHGLYIDGDGSYEIAYNNIHDIRSGNGFQIYVNGGNGSDYADDVNLHHNWIHNVSKHGLNIADGSRNNITISNNVVFNTAIAGVRFNTVDLNSCRIYNNTLYNTNTSARANYGALMSDADLSSGALDIRNNIFWAHAGTLYEAGDFSGTGTITRNLWHGGSGGYSDSDPVAGDPRFVSPGSDFRLQSGSPAIDAGSSGVAGIVTDDYTLLTPRPSGTGFDIGAFEAAPASPDPPHGLRRR